MPTNEHLHQAKNFARELTVKLHYAYGALIFGSLALSLQFSPAFGDKMSWLLVISWGALLISGFICAWVISREVFYYELQYLKLNYENRQKIYYGGIYHRKLSALNRCSKKMYKWQTFFFITGLVCNMVFTSINYLEAANQVTKKETTKISQSLN